MGLITNLRGKKVFLIKRSPRTALIFYIRQLSLLYMSNNWQLYYCVLSQNTLPSQHLNFLNRMKKLINSNLIIGTRSTLHHFNYSRKLNFAILICLRANRRCRGTLQFGQALFLTCTTLSNYILRLNGKEC